MSNWFPVLFCIVLTLSGALGEMVVEFDGKEWVLPEGVEELTEENVEDGICFTADAGVACGIALEGMGLEQLLSHPVRYALRGQEGRGAELHPIDPGNLVANRVVFVVCDKTMVTVVNMPVEPGVAGVAPESVSMGVDFEDVKDFLGCVRKTVKVAEEAGEVPRVVLVVRSETSFGLMVRVLQLVRSAGCETGLVRLDDELPGLDFKIFADPEILPPVAKVDRADRGGRIVVNIKEDGTLTDGENVELSSEEDVRDYVKQEEKRFEAEGLEVRLYLRGDQDSVFKHSRRVIRCGSEVGVDQVVFAVHKSDRPKKRDAIKFREQDLGMKLPENVNEGDEGRVRVEISIDGKGVISMVKENKILDTDVSKRTLPLLEAELNAIAAEKKISPGDMIVSMSVDALASQQRVVDVLNLLAKLEMTRVTFADPKDGE